MNVGVIVPVCVIAPVILAALVNGNEAVAVIDGVNGLGLVVGVSQDGRWVTRRAPTWAAYMSNGSTLA